MPHDIRIAVRVMLRDLPRQARIPAVTGLIGRESA